LHSFPVCAIPPPLWETAAPPAPLLCPSPPPPPPSGIPLIAFPNRVLPPPSGGGFLPENPQWARPVRAPWLQPWKKKVNTEKTGGQIGLIFLGFFFEIFAPDHFGTAPPGPHGWGFQPPPPPPPLGVSHPLLGPVWFFFFFLGGTPVPPLCFSPNPTSKQNEKGLPRGYPPWCWDPPFSQKKKKFFVSPLHGKTTPVFPFRAGPPKTRPPPLGPPGVLVGCLFFLCVGFFFLVVVFPPGALGAGQQNKMGHLFPPPGFPAP